MKHNTDNAGFIAQEAAPLSGAGRGLKQSKNAMPSSVPSRPALRSGARIETNPALAIQSQPMTPPRSQERGAD